MDGVGFWFFSRVLCGVGYLVVFSDYLEIYRRGRGRCFYIFFRVVSIEAFALGV